MEDWQSCMMSETAQFSISSETSAEIATLLQRADDCSKCAQRQQQKLWSPMELRNVGRTISAAVEADRSPVWFSIWFIF